jgi:predicted PurR-regulated permease PerM
MLKLTKQFLLLCLIVLQFVAPFIHAHAFEHNSFTEHVLHLHATEMTNNDYENEINQTQLHNHEIIGAITSVANGIKTSITDGIVVIAVFFSLALLIFNVSARFVCQSIQFLHTQRYFYSLHSPRAPPR